MIWNQKTHMRFARNEIISTVKSFSIYYIFHLKILDSANKLFNCKNLIYKLQKFLVTNKNFWLIYENSNPPSILSRFSPSIAKAVTAASSSAIPWAIFRWIRQLYLVLKWDSTSKSLKDSKSFKEIDKINCFLWPIMTKISSSGRKLQLMSDDFWNDSN